MAALAPGEITQLLLAWRGGDQNALHDVIPAVYAELRRLARHAMRAHPAECTLQTTAVINEAYLRLVDAATVPWRDRIHFLAVCAQMMRRVLVDAARSRRSLKRGGNARRFVLDESLNIASAAPREMVQLDDALNALAYLDPRKAKGIELRFFGGLDVDETAEALGVSRETVLRDWRLARAWLKSQLTRMDADG